MHSFKLTPLILALFAALVLSSPAHAQDPTDAVRDQFVTQLFLSQLGRDPTTDELSAQVALLDAGTSRSDLVGTFQNTTDFRTAAVQGTFETLLQRNANDQELAFWLRGLGRGVTMEDLSSNLLASPEFFAESGGTNNDFLQALFQDVLGRAPNPATDAAVIQQSTRLLQTGNRTAVVRLLANTRAAREQLIRSQFQRLLGRPATQAEVNFWVGQFQRGRRITDLMAALTGSDEFFARADLDAAADWVARLYADLLGRTPTDGEVDDALSALLQGDDFLDIAAELLTSDQYFIAVTERQYFRLLGRTPTFSEAQQWLRLLRSGGRVQQIIAAIVGSAEYFRTQGGGTANGYLRAVYQDLLGRDPLPRDASRIRNFTRIIGARLPLVTIPQLLQNSPDYRGALVEELYEQYLGRDPSGSELNAWIRALAAGGAQRIVGRDIIAALVSSDEYYVLSGGT